MSRKAGHRGRPEPFFTFLCWGILCFWMVPSFGQVGQPYYVPENPANIQAGTFRSEGSFSNPRNAESPSDLVGNRTSSTPGSTEILSGDDTFPELPDGGNMAMAPISKPLGTDVNAIQAAENLPNSADLPGIPMTETPTNAASLDDTSSLGAASLPITKDTKGTEHEGKAILEVQIVGNERNSVEKIMQYIYTRPGRPFQSATLDEDIRRMSQSRLFTLIEPYIQAQDNGVRVIFNLRERPIMKYLRFQGNEHVRVATLTSECGLVAGKPVSPYDVEEGRKKLETFYRSKGFGKVVVKIAQGDKTTDLGVIYQINEGPKFRVAKTNFIGNTIVSGGRLKTVIQSKPGMLWLFQGELRDETLSDDVRKLEDYYRRLGFFYARIGRKVQRLNDNGWSDVTFVINEGPQAHIREIRYVGNQKFDEPALREDLKIFEGKPFNKDRLDQSIAKVRRRYGKEGYVFANINAEARVLDDPGQCDIVFSVVEGKTYRVGRINVLIEGDFPHTQIFTIMNRLSVKPGDLVNVNELQQSERRLKSSQLFAVDPSQGKMPKIVYSPPELAEGEEIAKELGQGAAPQNTAGNEAAPPRVTGAAAVGGAGHAAISGTSHTVFKQTIAEIDDSVVLGQNEELIDLTIYGIWAGGAQPSEEESALVVTTGAGTEDLEIYDPQTGTHYRTFVCPSEDEEEVDLQGRVSVSNDDPAYATPAYTEYTSNYPPSSSLHAAEPGSAPAPVPAPVSAAEPGTAPSWASGEAAMSAPPAQLENVNPQTGQQLAPPPQPGISNPDLTPFSQRLNEVPPGGYSLGDWQRWSLPITIQTEETTTGRLMFSVGVSSDSGLVGSVVVEEQNFDWRRWPRSWDEVRNGTAWRGRGQHFRMEAMPGTEVSRYAVSFDEPYLFNTQIGLGLSGMYYDRIYKTWDENRIGGKISLSRALTHDMRAYFSFRGYHVTLDDPAVPTPERLENALGGSDLLGFSFRLVQDRRDSSFLATEGYFASLEFEQVVGTWSYPRFNAQFKKYWMLAERADMSGRHVLSFNSSFSWTGDDTPIYESFFAGGASTIRGFDYRGVSPRDGYIAVGGNVMLLASLEYLFPLSADDMIRGVVFIDTGTVEKSLDQWDDKYRVALGFGFRISMPMLGPAPMALDFAFPISDNEFDEREVFNFTMGWQR